MIMYEKDPDVVRWGLDLLDVCSLSYPGPCHSDIQYDIDSSQVQYVKEGYCENNNVENDEILAYTLQEELSRLAVVETSGPSEDREDHLQASILAQDWFGPSQRHSSSGHEDSQEHAGGMECSSSWDTSGEESHNGQVWSYLPEITDETALDGEVGKRFDHMVPVPHVPKINGELPTVDEATSDHQRLLDRLQLYDLVELKVQGDGNCQFRALSDQFYRTPDQHKFVRQQVVYQLKYHPELYEGYVPMAYGDYVKNMSKSGEWGDHVTLQAAADSYGVKIFVMTSFKDTCYIEILPNVQKSQRVIFLSFWAEVHYNSIYPEEELPDIESKKKKKWWKF